MADSLVVSEKGAPDIMNKIRNIIKLNINVVKD
jgi:hypothetical protein